MLIAQKLRNIALVTGVLTLVTVVNAGAEDEIYDSRHWGNASQQQQNSNAAAPDHQYQLPRQYQGRYYPNDETVIGYHGSTNTSDNSQNNSSYYYYYY